MPKGLDKKQLSIGEAADYLGVAIQTLRRWQQSGKLQPSFISPGGHRYYNQNELILFRDPAKLAYEWASAKEGTAEPSDYYCQTSSIFQGKLASFENALRRVPDLGDRFSLITAIIGEIGDNAFAHNLGKWLDVPGILFIHEPNRRKVVIADRGIGVLATLRRVKPSLQDDREALVVAFTERLSGRTPENRGNGLKFVRQVIKQEKTFGLRFQSGTDVLSLHGGSEDINVDRALIPIRGTLAVLNY